MAGSGIAGGIANGTRAARRAGQGLVLAAGLAAGMAAGLGANLVLIGPLGFSLAAAAQFVLVSAAFGSRSLLRDAILAPVLCLAVWFLFVQVRGVNIGAGLLEGAVLTLLGQEAP